MSQKINDLRNRSSSVTSGLAYFGNLNSNFQLVIRCPIHVYCAIKKSFENGSYDIPSRFFSGSIDIHDIVLPEYRGIFIYRASRTRKVSRFHASFYFPLDLNTEISDEEYLLLHCLIALMELSEYEYFDQNNTSLQVLVSRYTQASSAIVESFKESFCCLSRDK